MTEPTPPPPSLPRSERFPLELDLAVLIDPEAFDQPGPPGDRPGKAQRSNALQLARRLLDAGVTMPASPSDVPPPAAEVLEHLEPPHLDDVDAVDAARRFREIGPHAVLSRDLRASELYAVLGLARALLNPDDAAQLVELCFVMKGPPSRGVVALEAVVRR